MCMICVEIAAERMRPYEAQLARVEWKHVIPPGHEKDLEIAIQLAELRESLKGKLDTEGLRDKPISEEEEII